MHGQKRRQIFLASLQERFEVHGRAAVRVRRRAAQQVKRNPLYSRKPTVQWTENTATTAAITRRRRSIVVRGAAASSSIIVIVIAIVV